MGEQTAVNTRALEIAMEAKAGLAEHEDTCLAAATRNEERLILVGQSQTSLHSRFDTLQRKFDVFVSKTASREITLRNSIILALLSALGYVLKNGVPWLHVVANQ